MYVVRVQLQVDQMGSQKKVKKTEKKPAGKKTPKKMATNTHSVSKTQTPKPVLQAKDVLIPPKLLVQAPSPIETIRREGTGFKVTVERIEGETTIGDLIVVFPWTRETLFKHGLNLDVDEAGDIYMSLSAFAAIHGLKTESLIRELVEVSRQPPPPKPQPTPSAAQLAHAPTPAV